MPLPLHLLRLFAAVAECRSFTRAAEALHVSQPAVSKGVRELEAQVGTPLIERARGGVTLTTAGAVLIGHAREIFAIERTAERQMRAIRGLDGGRLAIGASTTIAAYHLPPVLAAFHADYANVELQLVSANSETVAALLVRRDIDIALVEGPVADARIDSTVWRREDMVLVASPRHALARQRKPVGGSDLADALIVVREPGSGTRMEADRILGELGGQPARYLEVGSTEAIKQIVAAAMGISVLAYAAVADLLELGRLAVLPTSAGPFQRPLRQLHLRGRRPSVTSEAFQPYLAGPLARPGPA